MTDDKYPEGVYEPDGATDILRVVTDDYTSHRIETPLLASRNVYDDVNAEFGISVHTDGPDIALSAGTTDEDGDNQLYTYHQLDVEKTRALAEALTKAADMAEKNQRRIRQRDSGDDGKSFVRRLMSR